MRPEEQREGDSVVAAFNQASDAIAAALDIQGALSTEPRPGGAAVSVRAALRSPTPEP